MIALLLRRLLIALLVAFAGTCALDQLLNPSPLPLLINAGLVRSSSAPPIHANRAALAAQGCAPPPPPLLRSPLHRYDYRLDRRAFNDKRTA